MHVVRAAHEVEWSHLSTLQVSPHGSLAADGQASVVQHAQEKQLQAENHTSRDA